MKYLVIILLAVLVAYGAWWLAYEMEPALMTRDCIESHTVMRTVLIGKMITQQPHKVCDEYGPYYPNPRHAAWLKRHPRE